MEGVASELSLESAQRVPLEEGLGEQAGEEVVHPADPASHPRPGAGGAAPSTRV